MKAQEIINRYETFHKRLNFAEQTLLYNYVKWEVTERTKDIMNEVTQTTDYCIGATLIELFPELEREDITKILDRVIKLKIDLDIKGSALRKKFGKGIEKEMEKIAEKIMDRVNQLVKDGINQPNALKLLKNEFKGIPTANLIQSYKKAKEEYKSNESAKNTIQTETEVAAEYILSKEPPASEKPKFEVLKEVRILDLRGKFGDYHIEGNKLEINEQVFNSIKDIEQMYETLINDLVKKVEELRYKENEAKEVFNEFIR